MNRSPVSRTSNIFYGWWVVLAGFVIMGLCVGIVSNCASQFIKPIAEEYGWSRASVSTINTIFSGCYMVISFMAGKAIMLFAGRPGLLTGVIALGSVLFFVSDLMLVLHRFSFQSWAAVACLALYFPAQCLLAHSGFYAPDRISQC